MAKKKKAKKKSKAKGKAKTKEMLVVTSKIKAYVKGKKCMCSGDLAAAVNDAVIAILGDAVKRATANRRRTVKPQDI